MAQQFVAPGGAVYTTTADGKLLVLCEGLDEHGVQHSILVTSMGKVITRVTGVDANGVQHTLLLTSSGKVITQITGLDEASTQRVVLLSTKGEVRILGDLDLEDSTTVVLIGAATYTSASFGLDGYQKIVGSAYADQPGTLYIEQSQDNTNWDIISSFPVNVDLLNPRGVGFQVDVLAPHGRVRYVNLATAQTAFRLYAYVRVI